MPAHHAPPAGRALPSRHNRGALFPRRKNRRLRWLRPLRPLASPCLVTWACLFAAGAAWAALPSPYGPAKVLARFKDPRISESSGLAAASRSDAYFFTHNDSGDQARIFAVDRNGETLATFKVPGARSIDWEDIARATDEAGGPVLYLADIGDNASVRKSVTVYRVPEPLVDLTRTGEELETAPALAYELVYDGGPRDAEALMAHPRTGQLFVISKGLEGSAVYAAPHPLKPGAPNTLRKVASIELEPLPRTIRGLRDVIASRLVTAADLAPDGSRVVMRTYTDAYEWKIPGADVAAAFSKAPAHLSLPETRQGEAIAYSRDGRELWISTEGAGTPIHSLSRR